MCLHLNNHVSLDDEPSWNAVCHKVTNLTSFTN